MAEKGFKVTRHKGFHITFENGLTVSVQFGVGNYCENRDADFDEAKKTEKWTSRNAEVAIWDKNDKWLTKEYVEQKGEKAYDDVVGWVLPSEVLKILNWAENYKEGK